MAILYLLFYLAIIIVAAVDGHKAIIPVCSKSSECMNGGVCEKTLRGTVSIKLCNCENSTDEDGSKYTGPYCQEKIISRAADDDDYSDDVDGDQQNNDDDQQSYNAVLNGEDNIDEGLTNEDIDDEQQNNDDALDEDGDDDEDDDNDDMVTTSSKCDIRKICYNGGICYGNTCQCRNGFVGLSCEDPSNVVSSNNGNNNYNDGGNIDEELTTEDADGNYNNDDNVDEELTTEDVDDDQQENDDALDGDDDEDDRNENEDDAMVTTSSKCDNGKLCFNGGMCYRNTCQCRIGFKGLSCEDTSSVVSSNNGNNSTNGDNAPTPHCDNGTICYNNGICMSNRCTCWAGFTGRYCENASGNDHDDNGLDNGDSDDDEEDNYPPPGSSNDDKNDNENSDNESDNDKSEDDNNTMDTASKCDDFYHCFNGGACSGNRCECRNGFTGEFCGHAISANTMSTTTQMGNNNMNQMGVVEQNNMSPDSTKGERNHSSSAIIFFVCSLTFFGATATLMSVAYTRYQKNNSNEEEQMREALTADVTLPSVRTLLPRSRDTLSDRERFKTISELI